MRQNRGIVGTGYTEEKIVRRVRVHCMLYAKCFVFSFSFPTATPPNPSHLLSDVHDYLNPFLQCAVLFCQSFTGIMFAQPEDSETV